MKYKQSISVFMPAYNEEENIGLAIKEATNCLKKFFNKYELIIVNDGSTDKTKKIAAAYTKKDKNIRLINHPKNLQYGRAFKTGFESAKNELIFYTDADRQFDFNEISNLMEHIDRYDLVIGYRKDRKDSFMRIIYSKIYNLALRLLLGIPYKDIDCAFKICHKRVIDKIKPFTCIRSADSELLGKAIAHKFKIKQIPVTHLPRKAGSSEAEIRGDPGVCRTAGAFGAMCSSAGDCESGAICRKETCSPASELCAAVLDAP